MQRILMIVNQKVPEYWTRISKSIFKFNSETDSQTDRNSTETYPSYPQIKYTAEPEYSKQKVYIKNSSKLTRLFNLLENLNHFQAKLG